MGVSIGKLKDPPKSCIPSNANIKMKRKSRNKRDIIEDKAFMRAITRFRSGDQYLKKVNRNLDSKSPETKY